jgi:hypothetical protein
LDPLFQVHCPEKGATVVVQVTTTLVTEALALPLPPATVQLCADGWVSIVTLKVEPLVSGMPKVNEPLVVRLNGSLPLSCKTSVPLRPLIVPPMVNVAGDGPQ